VANDIHKDLTNFWCVLKRPDQFERFIRMADATPFGEPEWEGAHEGLQTNEADPVQRAYWFFVACRQSLAGRMKCFAPLSRTRVRRGMNEQTSAWQTAVKGLPEVHARLMRVVILDRPALEVIRAQDGEGTLFYCDPPYVSETRTARKVYAHEMTEADHRELLATLRKVKGKVILSGYSYPLYEEALAGWGRHTKDVPNNAAGGDKKARKLEVIWCNWK
jgi:DNA adenine methylase